MNVGERQRRLSTMVEQDPGIIFHDLYGHLWNRDWLRLAHDYVAQNAGSITAGCDGMTMKDFDRHLEANLECLREDLKAGTFTPHPVRRVYIPKVSGRMRPLGIPSIRDRIVQEALRMVLEPIYEAEFSPYSFGFRPNRCTMDAIKAIRHYTNERMKFFWIIEGDLASYFDTINHRVLLKVLRRRVQDRQLLDLVWKFLRAGVMEKKLFRDTSQGTPQGGIASPLLANIYLHELDRYMQRYTALSLQEKRRRRHAGHANFAYSRYADDWVVLCNGSRAEAEALKEELTTFLHGTLQLTLSPDKTKITHLNDGFKFLGFWLQRKIGYHGGMTTKVLIPREALRRCVAQIKTVTQASTHQHSVATKILAVNRIISGWCRYYQHTARATTTFRSLEYQGFWAMAHWLGRKYQLTMPQVMQRYRRGNTLATGSCRLRQATEFKTQVYKKRFIKPNPYTTQAVLTREDLAPPPPWHGQESRPGFEDLRPLILERDAYTCGKCGQTGLTLSTAEIDHKRPVRRFKLAVNANGPDNLWTLCIPCHRVKTQADRQGESPVR